VTTYSFKDVSGSISGPGGNILVGMGAGGVADEGISFERAEDRNTMQTGADGEVMHSLHAADHGTVRIRLLKTSASNGRLMEMYKLQRQSGSLWGRNVISVNVQIKNERITASEVAFTGEPALAYGKTGTINEWTFHAGHIVATLDSGVAPPVV
jgi:hypothetical protein